MRLTRYHLFLLGGLFVMIMGPLAFTQPGPGGEGRGNKGGGKGGPSPDMMFMFMSGGNDTIDVAKVQLRSWGNGPTAEQQKEQMLTFLQKKGVKDGIFTKAVFAEYWEERSAERRTQWEAKQKQGGLPPTPGAPPVPGAPPALDIDAQAREQFALLDTDKNGSLSVEEMQAAGKRGSRLYDERDKWDTNKNGTIELPEYIEYYKNRVSQNNRGGRGQNPPATTPVEPAKPVEDDKRPIVYRMGKMPKELPPWFEEADTDKDGQVGLYEWKASGKSVREFMAMDYNGDGFITAEEVLRHQRATVKLSDTASSASPYASTGAASSMGSSGKSAADPTQGDNARSRGKGGFGGGNNTNGGGRGKGNRTKGN